MKRELELLAPGGDVDSIKAAILAGADAVYCGLNKFNARNRAENITFENLQGILNLAHNNSCKVFLTLNIIIVDSEISALINLLNKIVNTSIDGVIVQDLGLFYLLSEYFNGLEIHASTQFTTHNSGQIQFLEKFGVTRVNLSRELNISEIKELSSAAHRKNISTEVFIHGSYCISFSGICYMSSVQGGNSGNRGRCSQPCRDKYEKSSVGKNYPLNLKDNSAYFDLKELYDAGVYSLKIEGRIKEFEYVYTVVKTWKNQILNFLSTNTLLKDNSGFYKVFNRDFSNAFLKGDISKDAFIDNPMSHSLKHLSEINGSSSNEKIEEETIKFYEKKEKRKIEIKNRINQFSIAKSPLEIVVSGECGAPLKLSIKSADRSFDLISETNLSNKGREIISLKVVLSKLKAINETQFFIENTESTLGDNLFLPFKELTSMKKRLLFILNDSKAYITPVNIPKLKIDKITDNKPTLSVLISSKNDIDICKDTSIKFYFQLPNSLKNREKEFVNLFKSNNALIPWFPSILIGENYKAAVEILLQLKPKTIVTNNLGVAFEAYKNGISWIAGPFLNITNSYSLICLKEKFNCSGSFLSNEISKQQIKGIKKPENFQLHYSIYHPIILMTSRQCLFHQVSGCEKNRIDDSCVPQCERYSSITNMKKESFIIEKSKGNYHTIYNAHNYLNSEIEKDFPNLFSNFMIDLRDINTETKTVLDKTAIINLFKKYLNSDRDAKEQIKQSIYEFAPKSVNLDKIKAF